MPLGKVSVIIPVYNDADHVGQAIDSVLDQNYSNTECIVVNDGSTDNTSSVLSRYEHKIKIIHQTNKGMGAARNVALNFCSGEYIQFLDSDDLLMKQKLESQVKDLEASPGIDAVYCKAKLLIEGSDGRCHEEEDLFTLIRSGNLFRSLVASNFIWLQSCLFRRDVVKLIGGFDEEKWMMGVADWHFLLRVAVRNILFKGMDDALFYYRVHARNFTSVFAERMRAGCISALNKVRCQEKLNLEQTKWLKNAVSTQHYYYGQYFLEKRDRVKALKELVKSLRSIDALLILKLIAILLGLISRDVSAIPKTLQKLESGMRRLKRLISGNNTEIVPVSRV